MVKRYCFLFRVQKKDLWLKDVVFYFMKKKEEKENMKILSDLAM